jgi:hypothetical protein
VPSLPSFAFFANRNIYIHQLKDAKISALTSWQAMQPIFFGLWGSPVAQIGRVGAQFMGDLF